MEREGFIHDDFLLENEYARRLYHAHAADMPIIDYHCHLSPQEIADDRTFENLTAAWLEGDHYKWRAMRALGVKEKYITGDASDRDKFMKWGNIVPYTIRNPLYHWTHLELARYFDITTSLSHATAEQIYEEATAKLNTPEYSVRNLLRRMNVKVVCTTDDPVDNLEAHDRIAADGFEIRVLPAFRPDRVIMLEKNGFRPYIDQLGEAADVSIRSMEDLFDALESRLDYFHDRGCRLSDHGLEFIPFRTCSAREVENIFQKRMKGQVLTVEETQKYHTRMLQFLGMQYADRGWVQQFHLGALRNNNTRLLNELGPDTGFDSIGDWRQATGMSGLFNFLERNEKLARTILYNLNPADNEVFATMTGNFYQEGVKGKMQFGSGWWFNDQKEGMERQLNTLSSMSLLSTFVGMLTDSRSFLSYPRHEYFRRTLCNLLGRDMEKGLIPDNDEWTGKIVKDICYFNAKNYFDFGL